MGRRKNADPKWLIPLICRLGDVTKAEIGSIRIFDNDTRFEIAGESAEAFGTPRWRRLDRHEPRIEPSTAGSDIRTSGAKPGRSYSSRKQPRAARG